jgi:cytoskeletal protein CcmA (bactofilin family)
MAQLKFRRLFDTMGEPASIIGQHSRFEGRLSGDGHFLVQGTVDGDSQLGGSVTIGLTGRWVGGLQAIDVVVAGTIEGDVQVTGRAEIRPTAVVKGSITAGQISIGEGARVDGKLTTLDEDEIRRFTEKREKTGKAARP